MKFSTLVSYMELAMNHLANRIHDCTMPTHKEYFETGPHEQPVRCSMCGTVDNVNPDGPDGEPLCVECLFNRACELADECGLT